MFCVVLNGKLQVVHKVQCNTSQWKDRFYLFVELDTTNDEVELEIILPRDFDYGQLQKVRE